MKNASPMIQLRGTGPQKRLSSLNPRLSPIMKYSFGGIVIGLGMSQGVPDPPQGLMKASFAITPLTTGWPFLMYSRSPGPATIRLMKFVPDSCGVGFGHAHDVPWPAPGTPQRGPSAPSGGWKTTMSPIWGSLKR